MKKTSVLGLMRHSRSLVAGIFLSSGMALFGANAQATTTLNLAPGWNLLGNSSTATLDVAAMFGDPNKVATVWKWDKSARSWAMYTPLMKHEELAMFAKSKGFAVLTRIGPKEGFWVNSSASFALNGSDAPDAPVAEADLTPGWNLVSDAQKIQPSQLSQNLKTALTASGKAIDAVWAWDMPTMKWRFYSPKLEAQSSTALSDYINSKGYLPFSGAMTPADGFWVNVGPAAATTLSGMASVGSPIVAATVVVKGSAAEATATTDANGAYSLDATKLATLGNPPYLVKVSGGTVSGAANAMTYYSVAQGAGMANVSPYTQLVTAAAAGTADLNAVYSAFTADKSAKLAGGSVQAALSMVEAKLKMLPIPIVLNGRDPLATKNDDGLNGMLLGFAALEKAGVTFASIQADMLPNATPAATAGNSIVVFGDSLSDGGTYAFASQLAGGGKFTTNPGPVWAEAIAGVMGYALRPAFVAGYTVPTQATGGTNYAQGGSRVTNPAGIGNAGTVKGSTDFTSTETFTQASTFPVVTQIDKYLAANNNAFTSKQLIMVMAGANDVFTQAGMVSAGAITPQQAGTNMAQAATELVAQVKRIRDAGGKLVMVSNLPDIGKTPFGVGAGDAAAQQTSGFLTQLVTAFNQTLAAGLAAADKKVALFDMFSELNAVLANPGDYGFVNKSGVACDIAKETAFLKLAYTAANMPNPDQLATASGTSSLFCTAQVQTDPQAHLSYVFADGVHPTSGMHHVVARRVIGKIGGMLATALP